MHKTEHSTHVRLLITTIKLMKLRASCIEVLQIFKGTQSSQH